MNEVYYQYEQDTTNHFYPHISEISHHAHYPHNLPSEPSFLLCATSNLITISNSAPVLAPTKKEKKRAAGIQLQRSRASQSIRCTHQSSSPLLKSQTITIKVTYKNLLEYEPRSRIQPVAPHTARDAKKVGTKGTHAYGTVSSANRSHC